MNTHKTTEKTASYCHKKDMEKILISFDKWFEKIKDKHIMTMLPETTIAQYCLNKYNKKAKDKAIISFVEK